MTGSDAEQGRGPPLLYWIAARRLAPDFPPLDQALAEPDGLLCAGGDLRPERLLAAYRRGIFPWYSEGQPILWWSPDPRLVLYPEAVHVSHSLRRRLARGDFRLTRDQAFDAVVAGCAAPRGEEPGTWISPEMAAAYGRLHRLGHAHSVECWQDGDLAGGLYGVALGRVFFGESMFSRAADASKVALVQLCRWLADWGYALIDCQVHTPHLERLGAVMVARKSFVDMLNDYCESAPDPNAWKRA